MVNLFSWDHCLLRIKELNIYYVSVVTVLNAFIEKVNESNHKPIKLWVHQGREFYNKFMQEWLNDNDILIYSTHNESKLPIAERFIKT